MSQFMLEFVIGFMVGAVVCLGKEFLFQRFILRGNKFFAMLIFWMRLLIDAVVIVGMFLYSVTAAIGAALGLSIYMVIATVQAFKQGH